MSIPDIKSLIPHRNSMLLLDELTNINSTSAEGIYKIKGNEFFLDGHYPDKKIVPGIILCEMMAQLTAAYVGYTRKIIGMPILAEIKNVKFKKIALPSDTLLVKMDVIKDSFRVIRSSCSVYINDTNIATAELVVAIK